MVVEVAVALARPAEALPGDGWAFEPKWDGWRGVLAAGRLSSRHGTDLSRRFSELLRQVPEGRVLDGEIVCWTDGRLDFRGLNRRSAGNSVAFVVFDILKHGGQDQRRLPYRTRRKLLTTLELRPSLHLVESTTDQTTALRWWEDYRPVGIEGLVAKRLADPYRPGQRDWLKLRHRSTEDFLVVGVTGTAERPSGLVLGQQDGERVRTVAVSLPLSAELSAEIGPQLTPLVDHPVPLAFGLPGQEPVLHLPLKPTLTVEVLTDGVADRGRCRHGVRVLRVRSGLV